MTDFINIWKNETKKIAKNNTLDETTITLLQKNNKYNFSNDELKCIKKCKETHKDINGMIFIYNTIKIIDLYLSTNRLCSAYFAANDLYQILNSQNYWHNIFKNDYSLTEAKSRLELKSSLKKLLNK